MRVGPRKAGAAARNIGAIVLAAGASTRLGHPKQLVVIEGVPLVRRTALAARDAGAAPVIVVLGADAATILPVVDGLDGVTTVHNPDWETGIASSLAAGLRALDYNAKPDAALVTLSDQPFVDVTLLRRLLDRFDIDRRIIASEYSGVLGVPAVFPREHFEDLMSLTGDHGAGQWLRARSAEVSAIPTDAPSIDIDTVRDLERFRNHD